MKKATITKCKKIALFCLIIFLICAVINIILGIISVCNTVGTSNPWYTPIIFVGMYYAIPLILLFTIYMYFRIKERKIKG